MAVYDRWHKSRPQHGDPICREHGKVPTTDHGKGERWQVRWRDDTGRQCKANFGKRSDADTHDAIVRASLTAGTYVDAAAGKIKFALYGEQWRSMQVHREQTSALTERSLRLYVNPVIGDLALAMIRPAHVQQLVKQLSDELAPSTVAVVYGYVASIFKSAVRDRLVGRTPCEGIRLPAIPRRRMFIPDPAAVEAVADFLPRQYRAVPRAAARTGLRPSEMLGLEVDCIDFLRREVRVQQQLITSPAAGNVAYLAAPKTPQSDRTVPVTAATIELIAAHLAEFPAVETAVEDRKDPRNPVRRAARLLFITSRGEPVKRSAWSGVWAPAARKAGFPPGTGLRCCRHLFASALIRYGESVKTVQHLMGHSSPAITLNVYAHLWPDADDRARLAVEAAFSDVPSMCPVTEEG
jgi:integrase